MCTNLVFRILVSHLQALSELEKQAAFLFDTLHMHSEQHHHCVVTRIQILPVDTATPDLWSDDESPPDAAMLSSATLVENSSLPVKTTETSRGTSATRIQGFCLVQ